MRRVHYLLFVLAACGRRLSRQTDHGCAARRRSGSAAVRRLPGPTISPATSSCRIRTTMPATARRCSRCARTFTGRRATRAATPRLFMLGKRASFGTVNSRPMVRSASSRSRTARSARSRSPTDGSRRSPSRNHGAGYTEKLVMSPTGDRVWGLDPDTVGNHGGMYELGIRRDGTLEDHGEIVTGDVPRALVLAGEHATSRRAAACSIRRRAPTTCSCRNGPARTTAIASVMPFPASSTDGNDARDRRRRRAHRGRHGQARRRHRGRRSVEHAEPGRDRQSDAKSLTPWRCWPARGSRSRS